MHEQRLRIGTKRITIAHWDKCFFPDKNLTKGDLVTYYSRVAEVMIPFLKPFLVTLQRFPDGVNNPGFYQKQHQSHYPDYVPAEMVRLKDGRRQYQIRCTSQAALVYLVGQGSLSFHAGLAKTTHLNKPSRLLFDLDPSPETSFTAIKHAANILQTELMKFDLLSWVLSTGSRGLHVIVPLRVQWDFATVRGFAKRIAGRLSQAYPDKLTDALSKDKRQQRIFIDYTRNAYGQTSVSPYSVRPYPQAPIATPLSWDELPELMSPQYYTVNDIPARLVASKEAWQDWRPQALKKQYLEH